VIERSLILRDLGDASARFSTGACAESDSDGTRHRSHADVVGQVKIKLLKWSRPGDYAEMAKAAPATAANPLRAVLAMVDEQEEAHAVVPAPGLARHPAGFPEFQGNLDHIA
jgi:hypothetical protein